MPRQETSHCCLSKYHHLLTKTASLAVVAYGAGEGSALIASTEEFKNKQARFWRAV
jgi:hypothetical protein